MTDEIKFTVRSITNGYIVITSIAEHYCRDFEETLIYIERELKETLD